MAEDDAAESNVPPGTSAGPSPSAAPQGPPQSPVQGGGTLPPQGAPAAGGVQALGKQQVVRQAARTMLDMVHTHWTSAFEYDSEESKGIEMVKKGLNLIAGKDSAKTGRSEAMQALMQRAIAAQKGGAPPAPGQTPGMAQPNRGPIPTMAGTQ